MIDVTIRPDEIASIIKEQIKNYEKRLTQVMSVLS